MQNWATNLIDSSVQCYGCGVFDRLFQIVSNAAAAVYDQFALLCIMIFCVLFAFYMLNIVWTNIKGGVTDPTYQKSLRPLIINSLVVFSLLGMGVMFPRFMTSITFEPVAQMTLSYSQALVQTNDEIVNEKVTYVPMEMSDDGFFRPQLRDTVIMLMKTTITQFQNYMKFGVAIMDRAFSWSALNGVGALIRHFVMFMVGLYIAINFFQLFIRFCFYFVDIIVAMMFYAFFFPLSLTMFIFKHSDAPGWMKKLGDGEFGASSQFKKLVNAIITLCAAVLTYTVIMVIVAKFFASGNMSSNELMTLILSGDIYADALSDESLASLTIGAVAVMVYVINYIAGQVNTISGKVMAMFDYKPEESLSKDLGDQVLAVTKNAAKIAVDAGKTVLGIEEKK